MGMTKAETNQPGAPARAYLEYMLNQGRDGVFHGYDLVMQTGTKRNGTVYHHLKRWVRLGMLTSEWEQQGADHNKPARRFYRFTDAGWEMATAQMAAWRDRDEAVTAAQQAYINAE